MADSETTFGLSPEKVVSLLRLGREPGEVEADSTGEQERAGLLRGRLAKPFPCENSMAEGVAQKAVRAVIGRSLQDQILNTDTPVAVLREIKAHGARLSRCAESEAERQTANVIYYAAIAGALVGHTQKISEFSIQELAESFSVLEKLPWLTPRFAQLFHLALQVCQDSPWTRPRSDKTR